MKSTTNQRARLVALLLASLAVLGACGRGDSSGGVNDGKQDLNTKGVEAPAKADPNLTGRPGLVVATNSGTWQKELDSPDVEGVAVIFVQPDGPAEAAGIGVGDVITKIDGEPSPNAERAAEFQLRAEPDTKIDVEVVPAGETKSVKRPITVKKPGANVSVLAFTDELIKQDPENATLLYLRARSGANFDQAVADINKAIEVLGESFIEGYTLRGELLWNRSLDTRLTVENVGKLRTQALNDWDAALRRAPTNANALILRSNANLVLGRNEGALDDANAAIKADELLPGAYHAVARVNLVERDYGPAARNAAKAIELNPYNVRYYEALAIAFMKVDRPEDADQTINAISDLLSGSPATRERLLKIKELKTDAQLEADRKKDSEK